MFTGARAFLARLKVKRLRQEAEKQAQEAGRLMVEVDKLGQQMHNLQLDRAKEDKKISKCNSHLFSICSLI